MNKKQGTGFPLSLFSACIFAVPLCSIIYFFFTFKSKPCLGSSLWFCERPSPINYHVLHGGVTKPTEQHYRSKTPPFVLARCYMGTDHVLNYVLMPYARFRVARIFRKRGKFSWKVLVFCVPLFLLQVHGIWRFFQFWVCSGNLGYFGILHHKVHPGRRCNFVAMELV